MIGITGGIGSGKSTIARELAKRGYVVYDCDREAKRIIAQNKEVQQAIIDLLGEEAFIKSPITKNEVNRALAAENYQSPIYNTQYVAKRVFADPDLLNCLNAIIHPAVGADILAKQPDFVESAILYESGLDKLCDKVIVIDAPEDIRIARTIARDYHGDASPTNINKVRARICAQATHQGDLTINNDGNASIASLVEKITHWM